MAAVAMAAVAKLWWVGAVVMAMVVVGAVAVAVAVAVDHHSCRHRCFCPPLFS
jgi:hypothetical protein